MSPLATLAPHQLDRTVPRIEIRCAGCSYGGIVAHLPDRCPMCGSSAWRALSSRSGPGRAAP